MALFKRNLLYSDRATEQTPIAMVATVSSTLKCERRTVVGALICLLLSEILVYLLSTLSISDLSEFDEIREKVLTCLFMKMVRIEYESLADRYARLISASLRHLANIFRSYRS